jgi:hypothetical protein
MQSLQRRVYTGILLFCLSLPVSGCALLIAGAAGGAAAGTAVSVKEGRETRHSPLTYAGTVLGNVVYVPAKAVFAAGGALTSGVSYVVTLGRSEPTGTIWSTTTGGDYVMTPSMIEGREPIHFAGATHDTRASNAQAHRSTSRRAASA